MKLKLNRFSAIAFVLVLMAVGLTGCGVMSCPSGEQGQADGINAGKAVGQKLIADFGQDAFVDGQVPDGALDTLPIGLITPHYNIQAAIGCDDYDKQFVTGIIEGLISELFGLDTSNLTAEQRQEFEQILSPLFE